MNIMMQFPAAVKMLRDPAHLPCKKTKGQAEDNEFDEADHLLRDNELNRKHF